MSFLRYIAAAGLLVLLHGTAVVPQETASIDPATFPDRGNYIIDGEEVRVARLAPEINFSRPRNKVRGSLNIVLREQSSLAWCETKMGPFTAKNRKILLLNCADALFKAFQAGFGENFSSVTMSTKEKKRGFELIILGTKFYPVFDNSGGTPLEYHAVLTKNGRDIYEVKENTPVQKDFPKDLPPYPTHGSKDDFANWHIDCQITLAENALSKLVEELSNRILLNNKLAKFL